MVRIPFWHAVDRYAFAFAATVIDVCDKRINAFQLIGNGVVFVYRELSHQACRHIRRGNNQSLQT